YRHAHCPVAWQVARPLGPTDTGGHSHGACPGLHGRPRPGAADFVNPRDSCTMRTWLRGKPGGLLTFLAVTPLVAGGLGWATIAALDLECDQHEARFQHEREQKLHTLRREQEQAAAQVQADFGAVLRLALWRLDSRVAPVLAREDARPYNHYSAV